MHRNVTSSPWEEDSVVRAPFSLFQTPTRDRRAVEVTPQPRSERCGKPFVIRMVLVTTLLATFVMCAGPLRQQAFLERFSFALSWNNATASSSTDSSSKLLTPSHYELSLNWSSSIETSLKTFSLTEQLLNESMNESGSSSNAPLDIRILSDTAWRGLLKRFQLAMQAQNFEVWLPVIVQGNKMFIDQHHLTTVQKERGRRFQLFSLMMHDALNLTSNFVLSTQGNNVKSKKLDFPLLDKKWNDRAIPLLMALGDQRRCEGKKFPRFGWCTIEDKECTMFALPSYNVYRDAPATSLDFDLFHNNLERLYPWSKKMPLAVWRGSATGRISINWTDLPRARLVNVSIHHPNLLDAAFVHAKQFKRMYPKEEANLRKHSRFAEYIQFKDFQKYRAVMDVDGNAWSDRFGNLLCLNSAVVKVQPSNKNYFFQELEPWVHYIPVAANMSNIVESLQFAVSNRTSRKVRKIVFRANEWCRTRLTRSSMSRDVFQTINSYLQLLGDDERRWRQWDQVFQAYQSNMTLVEFPVATPLNS